jgi:nucleoside phosphorylase
MPRAVILTALSVEYLAVRAHLSELREEVHTQGTVYERGQFLAEGQSWEVRIVEVGPGNPGAAVEAERAIGYFSPDVIFFVGVAGGIKDVTIGDVVAATEVYSYEFGKAGETFQTRPKSRDADYGLEQRARAEARKGDWLQRLAKVPDPAPKVFVGPIAAGEKVIASQQSAVFQLLRSHYEDAIAVEMEGFGFLSAVRGHKQVDAIVIRGISDLIDGKANADRGGAQKIAACHASAFAFQMLSKLDLDANQKAEAAIQQGNGMSQNNFDSAKSWQTVVNGGNVYIGENNFYGASPQEGEPASSIVASVQNPDLVNELVQRVRSYVHDDIQRLHGTMPLWGIDRWVPLGELFVDVNILDEVSSNRRSELVDLWEDFNQNPGYRGLDRMGLGKEQQRVSGLEVLARNTNLMVVGKPGSGKTTYLQRVVTECNVGNLQAHRIPVLIRLREFVDDGRGVNYAVEQYLERCWRLSAVEVQLVLDGGRLLLLLDGLDEVVGEDGNKISKQIEQFSRGYPQVQVVVTCRTQSKESRFDRFDYVEVADFNEPQVRSFAEHWFQTVCTDGTVEKENAIAFLDQLFWEQNKPICELATTPILLSLTCAVFQQTGKFYSKRSKLYEEGLELLLKKWDERRGVRRYEIHPDLSPNKELELLSYLALRKFEQNQYVLFEQAELEEYIADFLGTAREKACLILRAIESRHGLLIGRTQTIWSFSHLTFQEYLSAKLLVKNSNWNKLSSHIFEEKWRLVMTLGIEMAGVQAAELLGNMRDNIEALVARDEKIQEFLTWITEKALAVEIPYDQLAIRAIYFDLARGISGSSLRQNFSLAWAVDPELGTDLELAIEIGRSNHRYYLRNIIEDIEQSFEQNIWQWQFNNQQEQLLQKYYMSNILFIDCLSNALGICDSLKEQSKEMLLLPISETERHKY